MDGYVPPENTGYLLADVSRMLRTVYDRRVEPLGLTRAQWRALVLLKRMVGCTQTELALALEIEKPTAGKLIQRLESKGWVERRADATDGRTRRLYLTAAVQPVLERMQVLADDLLESLFAGVAREDAEKLQRTLLLIKGNLVEMNADTAPVEA